MSAMVVATVSSIFAFIFGFMFILSISMKETIPNNNIKGLCTASLINVTQDLCCHKKDCSCNECHNDNPYCSELIDLQEEGHCCYADTCCEHQTCSGSGSSRRCHCSDYVQNQKCRVKCEKCTHILITFNVLNFTDILGQNMLIKTCNKDKDAKEQDCIGKVLDEFAISLQFHPIIHAFTNQTSLKMSYKEM